MARKTQAPFEEEGSADAVPRQRGTTHPTPPPPTGLATEMTALLGKVVASADDCDCHMILPRQKTCDGPPQVKDWGLTGPVYKQAVEMVLACCAEAGHPAIRTWHSYLGQWRHDPVIPHDVLVKARALVADAMGVEWR